MIEQRKRQPATPPTLDGCLYFDEKGNRITREEFTAPKPYHVTVQAMGEHLALLAQWMRETEDVTA